MINFFYAHQVLCTVIVLCLWSAFVNSLEAPTATSTPRYVFWFKFLNALNINLQRAFSAKVENSPNFQEAVNLQQAAQGQEQTPVVLPSKP